MCANLPETLWSYVETEKKFIIVLLPVVWLHAHLKNHMKEDGEIEDSCLLCLTLRLFARWVSKMHSTKKKENPSQIIRTRLKRKNYGCTGVRNMRHWYEAALTLLMLVISKLDDIWLLFMNSVAELHLSFTNLAKAALKCQTATIQEKTFSSFDKSRGAPASSYRLAYPRQANCLILQETYKERKNSLCSCT